MGRRGRGGSAGGVSAGEVLHGLGAGAEARCGRRSGSARRCGETKAEETTTTRSRPCSFAARAAFSTSCGGRHGPGVARRWWHVPVRQAWAE